MKTATKKPGLAVRALGMLFPFHKPAQQSMRPALDGLELARDALARIQSSIRPTPRNAAPQSFADAQALWRETATRHGLGAQKIQTIQTDLDRRWIAIFLAGTVAGALGLAGVILICMGEVFAGAGLAGSLFIAGLSTVLLLRVNVRRAQVRARALVSWPQFRKAAGGIPAAIFSEVHLSAAVVDGGK